ncbi:hypothetical protein [Bauldia litoralis]|uniref:DUF998 domain-containing protein n=1 Tax=Bauldia litoralis TaxID=665467 RepID=A0A1G6BI97_9HYPH|nr:hypothetical protein [Bauldia litoralis]SDB20355.1 hypothetical protein SAMN02982931_01487 [Bauldia litoralis]
MNSTTRTARMWLGTGSALLSAALVFHGPPDTDLTVQLHHVADGSQRWSIVHWTAAVSLFLISGGAFLALFGQAAGENLPGHPGAWMVMALGALATFTTAVAEAAVVAEAAHAGEQATFDIWWAFSSGMANGFFALAIATGFIALAVVRSNHREMPVWAAAVGTAAGFLSALGWTLGEHMGVSIGGPVWLISTLAMCLWLVWFGLAGLRVAHRSAAQTTP